MFVKKFKISAWSKYLIVMMAVLVVFGVCLTPLGKAWDRFFYDRLFSLRGVQPPPADIIVAAIDEASFGVIDKQWPWPRSLHAQLIDRLFEAGAKTVVFDIIFAERSLPAEDRELAAAIGRHPHLLLPLDIDIVEEGAYLQQTVVETHPDLMKFQRESGFINLPPDSDGFIRRVSIIDGFFKSLSMLAALDYDASVLPPASPYALINFIGPPRTIKTVSYYQALDPNRHLPPNFFKDKLVFVGLSLKSTVDLERKGDHYPIPFTRIQGGYMAGVEIHAQITHNIIQQCFIRRLSFTGILICGIFLWIGSALIFFRTRPPIGLAVLVLAWGAGTGIALWLFSIKQFYVPLITIMAPVTACYLVSPFILYWQTWKETKFIRQAFSTYVSPAVVKQLTKNPELLELGGKAVEITAFFSDLEGFTGISEKLQPAELVELLNEFLTEMTDIILKHEGTVDKFEGDAIIAFFGAPNPLENHALSAVRASVEMQMRLAELREKWQAQNKPALKMRIGLCSGIAVVGNMGSAKRMDYTMMGDTVNTAARLEGVNKTYGTYTLISQTTADLAGDKFICREIDKIKVLGKKEPVTIYTLNTQAEAVSEPHAQVLNSYNKGIVAYRLRDWKAAAGFFEAVLAVSPDDRPSQTMLQRCRQFDAKPPADDWDGSAIMLSK
ncbi:adenylate/guanylate cyclase domain-containing protein [Desulfococcaceae bacterium HSG7]|nr:adenylate/guanylate cyclase domain-containing protein [Desulfococcaceae bacterium HSG7]